MPQPGKHQTTLFMGAHLDDVVIGAFSCLVQSSGRKILLNSTNNSPAYDIYPAAYDDILPGDYNDTLESNIKDLCKLTHIDEYRQFPIPDGQSLEHIDQLQQLLQQAIDDIKPDIVYMPSYQGGHIDHDILSCLAATLCVRKHVACYEYALYYSDNDKYVHNKFVDGSHIHTLDNDLLEHKRLALSSLTTKKADTIHFMNDTEESIRPLPMRDYNIRPTSTIMYESSRKIPFEDVIRNLKIHNII